LHHVVERYENGYTDKVYTGIEPLSVAHFFNGDVSGQSLLDSVRVLIEARADVNLRNRLCNCTFFASRSIFSLYCVQGPEYAY
jgi:hypothetical protein